MGHLAERYVTNGNCVECVKHRDKLKRRGSRLKPTAEKTDWKNLTPPQIDGWYERIRTLKPNIHLYKHKPLEELLIIYKPPSVIVKTLETEK